MSKEKDKALVVSNHVEHFKAWLNSPEGKKVLEDSAKKLDRELRKLREDIKCSHEDLNTPFNI